MTIFGTVPPDELELIDDVLMDWRGRYGAVTEATRDGCRLTVATFAVWLAGRDTTLTAATPADCRAWLAARAEEVGAKKAALDAASLFVLTVLAGAFIALGAVFSTAVTAGAAGALPYGVTRLLAGVVFSLGLILVVIYLMLYYRGLAIVAVSSLAIAALLAYLSVIVLGKYQGFAMSLAGIAGLIVAIGITADSFVVFF